MGDARKYIITTTETRPSGLTTVTLPPVTYNLLEEFSGVRDTEEGGSYEYFNITLGDLASLTNFQYEERVKDFLSYIDVDTLVRRNELLSEATFDDPACD